MLLNLFKDKNLDAIADYIEEGPEKTIWNGHCENQLFDSNVDLFIRDSSIGGRIKSGLSIFRIEDLGNGFVTIVEDDVTKIGPEDDMVNQNEGSK